MSATGNKDIFRNEHVCVRRVQEGRRVFWRVTQYNAGFIPSSTRHPTRREALQLAHRVTVRREQPDLGTLEIHRIADERLRSGVTPQPARTYIQELLHCRSCDAERGQKHLETCPFSGTF